MNNYDARVVDAVRRTLNAVRRMRLQAARNARLELKTFVDDIMAEEEALVNREVENLMRIASTQSGVADVQA